VVKLRTRQLTDDVAIAIASRDPQTLQWLEDSPVEMSAADERMSAAKEAWQSGRAAPLVIANAATDEPMGLINLQFRSDTAATVAYSVFPGHRGRGVASRAVKLITQWGMRDLRLTRVLIEVVEDNTASIKVAERAGFQQVATSLETDSAGERTKVTFVASTQP
jgi:RimJ/RimL family protein N-acetyltransferase